MKINKITWTAGSNDPAIIAGKTFTGGVPVVNNGVAAVRFDTPKINGQQLAARIENRPELAKLAEEYKAALAADKAEWEAKWAKQRDDQAAADKPHINKMLADEAVLVAQIPAGAIRVTCNQTGSLDGDATLEYQADGVALNWSDVTMIGCASAIRTGAMGAFDTRRVAYITRDDLTKIVADRQAKKEAEETKQQAEVARIETLQKTAKEPGKPQVLRTWSEERRAYEGGEWGDYVFSCTEYAQPDGTTTTKAINQF